MQNTRKMTVLADEVVKGHRVVTYFSDYHDKIMAQKPWRTEIVAPGQYLPTHAMNSGSREEALKAHRKTIAELQRE